LCFAPSPAALTPPNLLDAAKQRPHPGHQLQHREGFGQVVVGADTHELHFGLDQRFRLDTQERRLFDQGKPLPLTQREYELLAFLARHPGRSFGRDELLNRVWGHGFDGFEHTVNSHINRLRNKVEDDPRQPRRIVTVWGVGYRFEAGV
jgi:DNA-binding response OmpR family regulator